MTEKFVLKNADIIIRIQILGFSVRNSHTLFSKKTKFRITNFGICHFSRKIFVLLILLTNYHPKKIIKFIFLFYRLIYIFNFAQIYININDIISLFFGKIILLRGRYKISIFWHFTAKPHFLVYF
jgi:hypothetical protein